MQSLSKNLPDSSPFKKVLHTNVVPSDSECASIREFLEGPRKEVVHLTEKIARLQLLLDEATQKRTELNAFIDAHFALVSSARRLPDDIVRVPTKPLFSYAKSADPGGTLCLRPRLWASIHIVILPAFRLQHLVNHVVAWLERAGTVLLDILMVYSLKADSGCDVTPILNTLTARWRHIRLALTSYEHFASISLAEVPMLQTMGLGNSKSYWGRRPTESLALLATKSLRSIELPSTASFFRSPVSWRSLRHLKITRYRSEPLTHNAALAILQQCPVLQTCDLAVSGGNIPNETTHPRLSLPYLRDLSITNGPTPAEGPHLVESIILPALHSFHCFDDIRFGTISSRSSLFPSDTFLRCLRVNIRGLTSTVLLAALTDMPALQGLQIVQEPLLTDRLAPDTNSLLTSPRARIASFLRCATLSGPSSWKSPMEYQTRLSLNLSNRGPARCCSLSK
ncbi:F-box domain-containing protein [Mycena venus]|uniref:F-box domain-containing protein n=1 Tax=Mycena venus TaxID=2733690 RepID=A0A8H6Y3N7_9AGAR|nr:F-box domain-containing protein [Mycena venus]